MEILKTEEILNDEVYNYLKNYEIKSKTFIAKSEIEEKYEKYLEENYNLTTHKNDFIKYISYINTLNSLSFDEKNKIINFKPKLEIELAFLINDYEDKLNNDEVGILLNF